MHGLLMLGVKLFVVVAIATAVNAILMFSINWMFGIKKKDDESTN